MTNYTNNPMVNAIGQLNIEGNIIPNAWYKFFTFENGKPDLIAIHILSEIVYWYRPTTKRCEETGEVLGVYKKFKADLLQRSYESFAEWLGVSKRQVKEAMDRLCEKGVIFREFRSVNTPTTTLYNILFIGIDAEVLAKSMVHSNVIPPTSESTTPYVQTYDPLRSNVPPPTSERKTNTEITTKITTETTQESEYAHTQEKSDVENPKNSTAKKPTRKTSSAKKSTTTANLTADDLVNLTLADCKFSDKDFENYPNLGEWIFADMDYQIASDYLTMRGSSNKLTLTAIKKSIREASVAGLTLCQALEVCITSGKGWLTFKAEWYANQQKPPVWQQPQQNPNRYAPQQNKAPDFTQFLGFGDPQPIIINGDHS